MKLECVLTAVNLNPLYYEFIPSFIRVWKELFNNTVKIVIVLIADHIPEKLLPYKDYLHLFHVDSNINTAFIAQCIRLIYPAILNCDQGYS